MDAVDTIAAVSTPPGTGGIGVIRLSGPAALAIAQRLFVQPTGRRFRRFASHRVYHGFVLETSGERIDEALLWVMLRPRSYTREDVAEISCHGGTVTTQRVLASALAHGARLAEPGEFTKRAFLNGRLDLVQAEAVIDLINARTVASQRAAFNQLAGALSSQLHELREQLLQVSVYLEAGIDFPEEDLELVSAGALLERLQDAAARLRRLLATAERGRLLHEGLAMAIVGRPNVGKSSLLNALLGRDRAIVSPIPGTTRDTIEATLSLDGLLLRLVDTAGIRATEEALELEGVRRAQEAMQQAELLLVVLDGSVPLSADDVTLLAATRVQPRLLVRNKCDLPACWDARHLATVGAADPPVDVSAVQGGGLADLERAILQHALGAAPLIQDEVVLTRARHRQCLEGALENVHAASEGLRQGMPVEFVAFDVTEALQHLGAVLGEQRSDEVLERIFSRFCIGK